MLVSASRGGRSTKRLISVHRTAVPHLNQGTQTRENYRFTSCNKLIHILIIAFTYEGQRDIYMDKWTSTKILTEENILVLTTKEHIVHSVHSKQRTNGTHLRGL